MIKKTELTLIAALAVLSLSSPAFAQSYGVNAAENGPMGIQRQTRPLFHSVRQHRRQLYDMAPSGLPAGDPNSSAQTGGGSLGYNQMLLID
jgi:hypothetical protein